LYEPRLGTQGQATVLSVSWTELLPSGYHNGAPIKLPDLPFDFCYRGKNWRNDLFVSDNAYITFGHYGSGEDVYSELFSKGVPGLDAIFFGAAQAEIGEDILDNHAKRIGWYVDDAAIPTYAVLRYEGVTCWWEGCITEANINVDITFRNDGGNCTVEISYFDHGRLEMNDGIFALVDAFNTQLLDLTPSTVGDASPTFVVLLGDCHFSGLRASSCSLWNSDSSCSDPFASTSIINLPFSNDPRDWVYIRSSVISESGVDSAAVFLHLDNPDNFGLDLTWDQPTSGCG
jgi:hypothetical protein